MRSDRWVIDGYGSWKSIEQRCDAADTLILIDQPAWRHYWWAYKRNLKLLFRHNPDLPDGCSKWPLWRMMFRVVRDTRRKELPRLKKLLADRTRIRQFVLRSPREIEAFCREHLRSASGRSRRWQPIHRLAHRSIDAFSWSSATGFRRCSRNPDDFFIHTVPRERESLATNSSRRLSQLAPIAVRQSKITQR